MLKTWGIHHNKTKSNICNSDNFTFIPLLQQSSFSPYIFCKIFFNLNSYFLVNSELITKPITLLSNNISIVTSSYTLILSNPILTVTFQVLIQVISKCIIYYFTTEYCKLVILFFFLFYRISISIVSYNMSEPFTVVNSFSNLSL